jgi:hypothetical protein
LSISATSVQPQSLVISPERINAMDEQGIDIEPLSCWRADKPRVYGMWSVEGTVNLASAD